MGASAVIRLPGSFRDLIRIEEVSGTDRGLSPVRRFEVKQELVGGHRLELWTFPASRDALTRLLQ